MQLPKALSAALAAADENYLIGLCNKGTVNRAKKDLAVSASPETMPGQDGVTVRLGDISCLITAPLGESRCSCPSSAICRHRIAAILWLKGRLDAGPDPAAPPPRPEFQELRAYPPEKLAKQLGSKRLSAALFRHQSGSGPQITEASVVTVDMPWLPACVRLLEPLEHSTCTCHSKVFCPHKAEALLYWQLKEGVADPSLLQPAQPAGAALDLEAARGVCRAVQEALAAQLATQSLCIGPARAADSYLNQDAILSAALASKCDAIHPGYGFLSENPDFADRCVQAGLKYIGPSGDVIRKLGSKSAARTLARSAGVPVVPGSDGALKNVRQAKALAEE